MENFVYLLDTEQLKDPYIYGYWYEKMPKSRQKKVSSFIFEKDRVLSLGAGILLQKGLDRAGMADREIVYGKNGKPLLKNGRLHFNLSHSGRLTVCAFSEKKVGVDIEEVRQFDDALANFVYHKSEIEYIRENYAVADEGFTLLWTVKESIMKYFGTGLSLEPKKIYVDMSGGISAVCDEYDCGKLCFTTYAAEGHSFTVCSENKVFADKYETMVL